MGESCLCGCKHNEEKRLYSKVWEWDGLLLAARPYIWSWCRGCVAMVMGRKKWCLFRHNTHTSWRELIIGTHVCPMYWTIKPIYLIFSQQCDVYAVLTKNLAEEWARSWNATGLNINRAFPSFSTNITICVCIRIDGWVDR